MTLPDDVPSIDDVMASQIVTVGAPEFDLELADAVGNTGSRKSGNNV